MIKIVKRLAEISIILSVLIYVPGWIYRYYYFQYFGIQTVIHEFPPDTFLIGTLQILFTNLWVFILLLFVMLPILYYLSNIIQLLEGFFKSKNIVFFLLSFLFLGAEFLVFSFLGKYDAEEDASENSTLPSITIFASSNFSRHFLPGVVDLPDKEEKHNKEEKHRWCIGKEKDCSSKENFQQNKTETSSDLRLLLRHNSKLYLIDAKNKGNQKTYILESNEDNHDDLFIIAPNPSKTKKRHKFLHYSY